MERATVSIEEVSEITRLSKKSIYQLIRTGQIPAYRPGKNKLLFFQDEIENYLRKNRVKVQPSR